MKFVCERCHTKYSIADEKVRGKVLKVRCKTCTNVITVRETGATIDEVSSDAPRDPPISRSGSFDAEGSDGDTVVSPRAALMGRAGRAGGGGGIGGLPAAALFAPSTPIAPPPLRRTVPPALPTAAPEIDWYLAVDGAQIGPFSRARLIDKILAAAPESDLHVWNADFDGWKAPKDVVELQSELARRRRAAGPPTPPPPARRSSAVNLSLAAAGGAPEPRAGTGANAGAGAAEIGLVHLDAPAAHGKGAGAASAKKRNGVAASGAGAAVAEALSNPALGLGDLLGGDAGLTPPPAGAGGLAASHSATASSAMNGSSALSPAMALPAAPSTTAPPVAGGKANQLKLVMGALAVVVLLLAIVSIWLLRKPAVTVAVGDPVPPKPVGTDFAGMAERLAQEEANAAKGIPGATPPTSAPAEAKPVIARLEPPQKNTRGKPAKQRKIQTTPPPLSPTYPTTGARLTADASRFGDSTNREIRLPTGGGGGARTTPAQADISRVINNNRQGIQTCYQRALLRDNTLTHGKVTVRVSIGLSGKVRSVNLDAPAQFRALEPCIRDVMSRWAFPPSSEEYGTEFPVVLQGNQ